MSKRVAHNKKSHEQFVEEIYQLVGNEYEVIGEYLGANTKIKVKHNKSCGHIYHVLPASFLSGRRCPKCAKQSRKDKKRKTHEKFVKEVHDLVGNEYEVIGKYIGTHVEILIKHISCGYNWDVLPSNFLRGTRCLNCNGKTTKSHEEFVREVYEAVGDEYIILGKYKNYHSKVELQHISCGNKFGVRPSGFLFSETRCPKCNASKGENKIEKWLDANDVKFESQYRFDDCRNKRTLPFDFAIFKENILHCLIEFDGRQHFEPVDIFGGEEGFQEIQLHDDIKNKYCKDNNIILLRIPYFEFDRIDEILELQMNLTY